MDGFGKENTDESENLFVQEFSQWELPFPRTKTPPAKRDSWLDLGTRMERCLKCDFHL